MKERQCFWRVHGMMSLLRSAAVALSVSALAISGTVNAASACTGIRLIAEDGSVIHARTLEFGLDLESSVLVFPRGYARTGTTPDGTPGLQWTAKYASVGANAVDLPILVDGLNEAGLGVGLFYFPTTAGYMAYTPADAPQTIAPWELASWLLDNFADVDEVRAAIGDILVAATVYPEWGFAPPVHAVVHDSTGRSIVIEFVGGELNVHDNPLGVISNSPAFDWHMTNLRNYVNFSLTNVPPVTVGPVTLAPLGMGSGMLGLPGDFTPPSRFVRAVAFSQSVLPSPSGEEAVLSAFHILNNFDIPKGAAREHELDAFGNVIADYTIWTAASDLRAKRYYFRTFDNSAIRMVDLSRMDPAAADVVTIPMTGEEKIEDLTP
jgi:choloylglycine hydrolase